jgi:hypothetical protein
MGKAEKLNKKRKKEAQQVVFQKLFVVMKVYKNELKEKKLISKLQKVSKSFANDIIKASADKNVKSKKSKKKVKETEQQRSVELQPTF